jgi:hypothetical protein
MEVCQQFGFRFIWIDALCIMQDSYEDKMNEIRRMHSIYASADLTSRHPHEARLGRHD